MERIRKVDVESLSEDQLRNVEEVLSKKIKDITDRATQEANRYLNVYGFKAVMAIEFKKLEDESLE